MWNLRRNGSGRELTILAVVAAVGFIGFVVGWLVRRSSAPLQLGGQSDQGGGGSQSGNVTNIWNMLPEVAAMGSGNRQLGDATGPVEDTSNGINHDTRLTSMTVGNTRPVRVFRAPDDRFFYKLQIRAISPPGSFMLVATNPNSLRGATPNAPDAIVIPVGGFNEVRLRPRQTLYAIANVSNAVLSVAAYPEAL